jgi:hypothetical protein
MGCGFRPSKRPWQFGASQDEDTGGVMASKTESEIFSRYILSSSWVWHQATFPNDHGLVKTVCGKRLTARYSTLSLEVTRDRESWQGVERCDCCFGEQ